MTCQECSQLSLFISQTSDFGLIFLLWHISNPQGHMSGYDMLSSLIFDLNQHTSVLSTCHHHEIPFQSSVDFRRTPLRCPFQTDNSDNQLIKINQLWLKWTSHYKYCIHNSICCILKWIFQRMQNNVFIYLQFMKYNSCRVKYSAYKNK